MTASTTDSSCQPQAPVWVSFHLLQSCSAIGPRPAGRAAYSRVKLHHRPAGLPQKARGGSLSPIGTKTPSAPHRPGHVPSFLQDPRLLMPIAEAGKVSATPPPARCSLACAGFRPQGASVTHLQPLNMGPRTPCQVRPRRRRRPGSVSPQGNTRVSSRAP